MIQIIFSCSSICSFICLIRQLELLSRIQIYEFDEYD